jgi:Fe-S cluster assembly iron-binding protein IscA
LLQMTDGAAALLSHIRDASAVPDSYGVRIFAQEITDDEVSVGLGFTDRPMDGDEVTERAGVRLFVAREIAEPLAETTIDVAGNNGDSHLVFRPQEADAA